jgi:hypothetical protein
LLAAQAHWRGPVEDLLLHLRSLNALLDLDLVLIAEAYNSVVDLDLGGLPEPAEKENRTEQDSGGFGGIG